MTPERDRDVVRERNGDRDRYRNGVTRSSGGEKGVVLRGSWDRDKDGVRNWDRGRGREEESSRDIDRDRRVGSRSSGGERGPIREFSGDRFCLDNDIDAADLRNKEVCSYDERMPVGRDRGREYNDEERQPVGKDRGRYHGDDERRPIGRGRDRDRDYDDNERRPMGRDRDRDYYEDERRTMGRDRDRDGEHDDDERRTMGRGGGRGRGWGQGWGGRGRGDNDKPIAPPLYSVLRATVHSIRPFGIFVQMEGYRNHGLVHLSQVSDHEVTKRDDSEEAKVKALSSVANEGEEVWIKVISVKVEEDGSTKIGCSMKYVSQGDGTDLDPNNIQAEKQQSRPSWKEPQKFKMEAVYNVQCERCGGHGHLKTECYSSGEKTYKLLSDDEDSELAVQNLTKIEERLPRESSKHMQPLKPASGIPNHLLATGAVGRGRAVVQPAWMKHGIGVGGTAHSLADTEQKPISAVPEKVETVEDALAVIAMLKEEKHRRKAERHRKKDKRRLFKVEKKDKHKKRHRNEDERPSSRRKHRDAETSDEDDRRGRKKHCDAETSDEDDRRGRKKHRDVETSDEDDRRLRKKHRDEKVPRERRKRRDVEESDGDEYKEHRKDWDSDDVKENSKRHRDDDYKERRSSHSKYRD